MKRFGWRLIVFALALSVPLAYFVARTYRGMAREEEERLRFFAESLFDRMERDLAMFVAREEARPVDAFAPGARNPARPEEPFVLGYFQNDPDGSLRVPAPGEIPEIERLRAVNAAFNRKRETAPPPPPVPELRSAPPGKDAVVPSANFADRFLRRAPPESSLGQKAQRTEQLYPEQARKLASRTLPPETGRSGSRMPAPMAMETAETAAEADESPEVAMEWPPDGVGKTTEDAAPLQAEVGPLQWIFVDDETAVLFRRVAMADRIFRQGAAIRPDILMDALVEKHFAPQPLAEFSRLTLTAGARGRTTARRAAGPEADGERIVLSRTFPRPFDFLQARLSAGKPPPSEGRRTLTVMLGLLSGIMGLGLFAIHRSARTVTELAERRSAFVSAVTHELKTPLTNIRMYIEMLAAGMAATPERERDYFDILDAEATRLSRLIQNILDFSRLERRAFRVHLRTADPAEAIREARSLMGPAAERAGFRLTAETVEVSPIPHDRELLVQVLVNLIENSLKFGADAEPKEIAIRLRKEGKEIVVAVADTGPGVPRKALKKIFEEFYRVEGAPTRRTRGTGIGLAFVRRAATAMGGRVRAANNDGPGCTVEIRLPAGVPAPALARGPEDRKTDGADSSLRPSR